MTEQLKMAQADSLAKTERAILTFARRQKPESLQDLRSQIADSQLQIDDRLLNLAILQLLNTRRLDLSHDRRLHVREAGH